MINNNYYKPNISKEWIHKSPFRYSNLFSTYEENAYSYRFPVHRSGGFTTLECEVIIFEQSGNVTLNVFDYGTRDKYAAFYCNTYGKNTVLDSIHEKIKSELAKLGIVQRKDKVKKCK